MTVRIEASLIAHAQRMGVVAFGMSAHQLLVARLIDAARLSHLIVVAREPEPFRMTADKCCHGKVLVTARGRAMDNNQINSSHYFNYQLSIMRSSFAGFYKAKRLKEL